jgi:hypothetical protein
MTKHIRRVRKCRHSKASLCGHRGSSKFSGWISIHESLAVYWCPRCGGLAILSPGEKLISEKFVLPTAFQRIVIEDEP